jgi:hypothetical protein
MVRTVAPARGALPGAVVNKGTRFARAPIQLGARLKRIVASSVTPRVKTSTRPSIRKIANDR